MKHIHRKTVREVVEKLYGRTRNIMVMQAFKDNAWLDINHGLGQTTMILNDLYKEGYTAVKLKLTLETGTIQHPDYRLEEFEEDFVWHVKDLLKVWVNQGERPATVLAVIGTEALIEYLMPNGTSALWVIRANNPNPGCLRRVSYKACPKKWLVEMDEKCVTWECQPQAR